MNYLTLDISKDWKVFPLELDTGLLGHRGRAYQRGYAPADFVTSAVPVTGPAAWLADGRIADPYVGMNNRDILWMEQREWWFLKDFDLPRLDGQWRLVFEGVNYRAEAWLNDVQVGHWEGSFLTMAIDLDAGLLRETGNRLAVRVRAQERAWEDGTQPDPRGFQNSSAHIRTQGPTPQYAYGWNWSPHLVAVGIWRPVRLEWHEGVRFGETRIRADVSANLAKGLVEFTGEVGNLGGRAQNAIVELSVVRDGIEVATTLAQVSDVPPGGRAAVSLRVMVDKPALWYPNGHGAQPLYTVRASLLMGGVREHDRRERRIGFRRVEFIPNTNDVEVLRESGQSNRMWSIVGDPYPWTMVVNGRRIFSKGSNWCPVDNLYRDRDAHVRRLLEFARDAHYVFMRVWGGGLTESDHFYDCCDELGILCLQEFWFACGSAPAMNHRVFFDNVASELKRLRERTSIALWGGGNEFNPDNHENRPVIDGLGQLVARLDGTRGFRRGSPYKGDRHGGLVSTPHYTTNKYRDLLPGRRRLVLLRSECAVGRSPARPANIRKFIPEESLWPVDWTVYQNHHAQRPEWEMVSRPFGPAQDWEQALLYASVFHCLDSRMNMEFSRANKYECSGCWTWQLNASWPSFHREHIDWYGDAKPVYYWYKNACLPIISLADLERFVYHPGEPLDPELVTVNDGESAVEVDVEIKVLAADGTLLHAETRAGTVPADGLLRHGRLAWRIPDGLAGGALYLSLRTTGGGRVLHRNTYFVALSPDLRQHAAEPLGRVMRLAYRGRTCEVGLPHYYTASEIVDEPTEHDKEQKRASGDELDAVYSATFDVPDRLRGRDLEVHLPAVSGDDQVRLNGALIGEGLMDPDRHWNYGADPLLWPFLPARYYAVPEGLLKERGNLLEISVSGRRLADRTDKRFGLTRMVSLRERTPPDMRERIADYDRRMEFFTPVSKGPRACVEISATRAADGAVEVALRNTSGVPAAFVVLDLEGEGGARFRFGEGAFSALLPGEAFTTRLHVDGELPGGARVVVRGLNCAASSAV